MSADDSQDTAFLGPLLRLEAAGVDFAYRRFCVGEPRDGSTLILLPGYGGTMAEWTPQFLRRLAHRRQVVIFDYAGQGLSKELTPSEEPLGAQVMDSTLAFLDALGLLRPHLLGFSLGAFFALSLLARAPERVDKVISLAGFTADAHFVAGDPVALASVFQPENSQADRARLFFPVDSPDGAAFAAAWVRSVEAMPPDQALPAANVRMHAGMLRMLQDSNAWEPPPGAGARVLLLAGAQDRLVPQDNQHWLLELLPGASLVWFPAGEHGFFWQFPNKAAALIDAFLMPDA